MTSHCNGNHSKTCLSPCLKETENWNSSSKTLFYKERERERIWKPEGSLGRTAQDGHLDSHTAPEL